MKDNEMNLYEGMFIVSPTLSDDARTKALDRIKHTITETGGEIVGEVDMERRKLAYEIKDHREGHYFLIYFKADPSQIDPMWREYHLNEDLLRFMTSRTEKVLEKLEFKALAEVE